MKLTKTILWDFDGVILDSMKVRDQGFVEIFKGFPENQVDALLAFHRHNGGWSRFVKIRHFFEEIRGEEITDETVKEYATQFSKVMKELLTNRDLLIKDSVQFIQKSHDLYNFHVVSGSEQNELRFLCRELGIADYFISIHGSPTPKDQLVRDLLIAHNYNIQDTVLIGDSINDYEAALKNKIAFIGYNNPSLIGKGNYLQNFQLFNFNGA